MTFFSITFKSAEEWNKAGDHDGLDVVDEVDGVLQPQLALLHYFLWECPARSRGQGRGQHHEEPGHVEHRGLVDEEEEAARDHQNDHDQTPMLEKKKKIKKKKIK